MGSNKDVYQPLRMENTLPHDWHCLIKFLLRALNYEKDFQTMQLSFIVQKIILDKMPTAHIRITSQMSSSSSTLSDKFNVTESALDFLALTNSQGINWMGQIRVSAPALTQTYSPVKLWHILHQQSKSFTQTFLLRGQKNYSLLSNHYDGIK